MTLKQGSEPVPGFVTSHLYTEQPSVLRAKELIANHLAEGLSVARIAEECALSRSHFSRAFKKSTGMAPHAWLLQMRIEKAKEMLVSGQHCLSHIALECGFADQAHFTRVFSRWVGTTPSAWCRLHP